MPYINSDHLLSEIEELKKSPWYREGKLTIDRNGNSVCAPSDRYMGREEAIETIVDLCIKSEPIADVAPVVHAHWIYKYQNSDGCYIYECSSCGRFEKVEFKDDLKTMPHCHCGAKMDEEVEKGV